MEKRVLSFEDFSSSGKNLNVNYNSEELVKQNESHQEEKNYMFFQNLMTIKHNLEEIMAMDKSAVDNIISQGHDWANDHIATSKDDISEVADWLRNEIASSGNAKMEEPVIDEPISTEIEMIDSSEEDPEEEVEDDETEGEPEEEEEEEEEEELVDVEMKEYEEDDEESEEESEEEGEEDSGDEYEEYEESEEVSDEE